MPTGHGAGAGCRGWARARRRLTSAAWARAPVPRRPARHARPAARGGRRRRTRRGRRARTSTTGTRTTGATRGPCSAPPGCRGPASTDGSSAVIATYASYVVALDAAGRQDLLGGDRLDLTRGGVAVRRRLVVPQPRGERDRALGRGRRGDVDAAVRSRRDPAPVDDEDRAGLRRVGGGARRTRPRRRTAPARGTPGCRRRAGCAAGRCRRSRSARRRSPAATRRHR